MTVHQIRLLDFNIYNKSVVESGSSDSDNEYDSKSKTTDTFEIQMFGINEQGETYSLFIEDYEPFFYIKVGNNWTNSTKNKFVGFIQGKIGPYFSEQITSSKLLKKKKLYGFDGGKYHNFIEFKFKNTSVMNRVKYLYYKKNEHGDSILTKLKFNNYFTELYETQIPPLLRFFHINNISPSGWIQINEDYINDVDEYTTTCQYEFCVEMNMITALNDKETIVPYKICSFDIEASSSHGDFPIPIKNYKKLATNIVEYFQEYNIEMDDENIKYELEEIIYNAFQISDSLTELNCIDVVYPKKNITKNLIEKLFTTWLELPINKLKKKIQVI